MRTFLVGICDIFLILYLTTLSQVSPYQNSNLTVDDYNKIKKAEAQAISETERLKEIHRKLEIAKSALEKEKDYALQAVQSTEVKNKAALNRIEAFENEIKKSKEAEAKAWGVVNIEKEKVLRIGNTLSEALRDEEEVEKLLQKALEEKELALQRLEDAYLAKQIAIENEQKALLAAKEAQKEAEKSKDNEGKTLKLAEEAKNQTEFALQNERAARNAENKALEVASVAKEEKELALQRLEDAYLAKQIAIENEREALLVAKEAQREAEKAKNNEDKALKLAKEAQNQKEVALQNERAARSAENKALEVASAAKNETAETRLKIRTITQTADNAFKENINDKLVKFTVTIEYKNRLSLVNKKVITMHGLPVKIGNNYLIFVLLDQIGLRTALTPDKYISYNITVDDNPITEIYVKSGENKIAALVIHSNVKHSLPLGKIDKFSSYMPVLLSIHSQDAFSVMDRIRSISGNFFIFKRDHLRMISRNEFYYGSEGIRGTRDYGEYIKKGDHVVDLGGNFIGLAYKKNTIIRIHQVDGWHKISIDKTSARGLAKQVRDMISS